MNTLSCRTIGPALILLIAGVSLGFAQGPTAKPVKVTISEDKTEIAERVLPLDPKIRVEYQYVGNMSFGVTSEGKALTCGAGAAHTIFKIDGQIFYPDGNMPQQALPPGPNKKQRHGMQTTWTRGDVRITMILEVVPGRPVDKKADQKRRMDALMIKYVIENTGEKVRSVGARMYIDTYCATNDGAIFASPTTHPGKLLDGIMLKDKDVPEFVEMLQFPNLQNPGFKGVFTFKMGSKVQGPTKIVLTGLAAFGEWDVPAQPANGDSAVAFFWDPQEIKPKSKREIAFALGQGVMCDPEGEGKVSLAFGGSFEPNKTFTVTAYVEDPIEGQNLTLELPKGMQRLEGKDTQAVPQPNADGLSVVMWRCRVTELGTFPVRLRSSNGVTQTRVVTVAAE
jgi:hypothetical protein